jgi:hypothetical protein
MRRTERATGLFGVMIKHSVASGVTKLHATVQLAGAEVGALVLVNEVRLGGLDKSN